MMSLACTSLWQQIAFVCVVEEGEAEATAVAVATTKQQ